MSIYKHLNTQKHYKKNRAEYVRKHIQQPHQKHSGDHAEQVLRQFVHFTINGISALRGTHSCCTEILIVHA